MKQKPRQFKQPDINEISSSTIKSILRWAIYQETISMFPTSEKVQGFTLPATSYSLEYDLIDHYKKNIKISCVESVPKIFKASKKMANVYPKHISLSNSKDLDFFKANQKHKFNFLWLDYCGPYTKSKIDSLNLIFQNNLNFNLGNPLIGLTVMNGMDFRELKNIKDISLLYWDKFTEKVDGHMNVRLAGIPGSINEIANKYNKEIYPRIIFEYLDKTRKRKAVSMLMFIFEVYEDIRNFQIWNTELFNLKSTLLNRQLI